ncbi:MAG: hypothetical protein ACOYBY_16465 [Dermatophilaceae bacterium]
MADNDITQRLRALASDDKRRPETARLRDIFEEVEATLRAGVSQTDVLAELHAAGFSMTLASFKSALQRIRKERSKDQVKEHTRREPRASQPAALSTPTNPETDPATKGLTRKQIADRIGDQYVNDNSLASNPILKRLREKEQQDLKK